jgi:leucyl aminopeptidase (aminopeptidase T)
MTRPPAAPEREALDAAARTVVRDCLRIERRDVVLVLDDASCRPVVRSLEAAVRHTGAEPLTITMPAGERHGAEPPAPVGAAMRAASACIAPTRASVTHTRARRSAGAAGCRVATMPGITPDLFARLLVGDLEPMRRRVALLAEHLTAASTARLTCPAGTDLVVRLDARAGIPDDGRLDAPGACGNLPCGEAYVAPLSGDGVVAASVVAGLAPLERPARITVADGHLRTIEAPRGDEWLSALRAAGAGATNLAELGIGANERARVTPADLFESEKALGSAHVAFGASAGIGGTVAVPVHLDCVILDPTVVVGDAVLVRDGRFVP